MDKNYIVEVIIKQDCFVEIKAKNSEQAKDLVSKGQGEINKPYPPELFIKNIRDEYGA